MSRGEMTCRPLSKKAYLESRDVFLFDHSISSTSTLVYSTMSTEANRIKTKLATLGDSLEDLEALLEPLLSQSLPETVVGLETIQQAKLQVVLPYLVYDLIFSTYKPLFFAIC